jgi:hypothetical protein
MDSLVCAQRTNQRIVVKTTLILFPNLIRLRLTPIIFLLDRVYPFLFLFLFSNCFPTTTTDVPDIVTTTASPSFFQDNIIKTLPFLVCPRNNESIYYPTLLNHSTTTRSTQDDPITTLTLPKCVSPTSIIMDENYFKAMLQDIRTKCLEGYAWPEEDQQAFRNMAQPYQEARAQYQAMIHEGVHLKNKKAPKAEIDAKMQQAEALKAAFVATEPGIAEAMKPILQRLGDTLHATSDELVLNLMKCAILQTATPKYLADFIQEDPDVHTELIETLWIDTELQKQMLFNGGPQKGKWGHAMKLYLHQLLPLVEEDDKLVAIHSKFALAMALEHAAGVELFDQKNVFADPVHRFQDYLQAHRDGKLDPAFEHFTIWEMRHITNCDAPDEQMAWARDYLVRYSPDQAAHCGTNWRYAIAVKSDVGYRAPVWPGTVPRTYIQMVSGGGKCGPRAQYGRFMIKSWGLPSWGVKQPAHAAVGRWTSEGWIVILGADWPFSNWDGYRGRDFKPEAHARAYCYRENDEELYFRTVTLLECMAHVHVEDYKTCMNADLLTPLFPWFSLTRIQRINLAALAKVEHFERKGDNLVETKIEQYLKRTDKPADDNQIVVQGQGGGNGTIVIPSNAFVEEKAATRMLSFDQPGGQVKVGNEFMLLYRLPDNGIITAGGSGGSGEYLFSIQLVNIHLKQVDLWLTVDGPDQEMVTYDPIPVPYTIGEWKWTDPVKIKVKPGGRIQFGRKGDWALTIKQLTLTPC